MHNSTWTKVFLSLGSNMGNPEENLASAIVSLGENDNKLISQSGVYITSAWGMKDQMDFLNQVVLIETRLSPRNLLNFILGVEKKMGRERKIRYGPRIIDIDIIFYGNITVNEQGLNIPHPLMHKRNFVLIPMLEIAPHMIHPVLGKSIETLYDESDDDLPVVLHDGNTN